jgi:uncharacterized membrane protein YdbT with pleckstrin-like domain
MADPSWQVPPLQPRTPVAARRAVVRRTVLLAIPCLFSAVVAFPAGLVALALAGAGIPWGRAAHRRAGWGQTAELTAFAAGAVRHRIDLVPHSRVQSARSSASWFQRRVALATVALDVAGRTVRPHLYDVEAELATRLRTTIPRLSGPSVRAGV